MSYVLDMLNTLYQGDELAWLQTQGATADYIEDAWNELLIANGYSAYRQGGQREWLEAQTGISYFEDARIYALENNLYSFATRIINFAGDQGITLNGTDVSDWVDTDNSVTVSQSTATEQPAYSSGEITFIRADDTNLISSGHISSLDFGTGAFTLVLVFKSSFDFNASGQSGTMVNNGNTTGFTGFFMSFISSSNKVNFGRRNDSTTAVTTSNDALNDGDVHVGHMIFDGTTQTMAIDGVIQSSTNTTVVDLDGTGSGKLLFGTPQAIANFEYDGSLYQFRAYDGALSQARITAEATELLTKWS